MVVTQRPCPRSLLETQPHSAQAAVVGGVGGVSGAGDSGLRVGYGRGGLACAELSRPVCWSHVSPGRLVGGWRLGCAPAVCV